MLKTLCPFLLSSSVYLYSSLHKPGWDVCAKTIAWHRNDLTPICSVRHSLTYGIVTCKCMLFCVNILLYQHLFLFLVKQLVSFCLLSSRWEGLSYSKKVDPAEQTWVNCSVISRLLSQLQLLSIVITFHYNNITDSFPFFLPPTPAMLCDDVKPWIIPKLKYAKVYYIFSVYSKLQAG